ncbi:caspase domain-containing protein [Aspergillus cavernicola]|uniref:Caspase domain-containing protein n=1 Tax=Aspergillus cavernicola TaxID=176166 RepID=A0ABR4J162_9EURO
MPRKPRKLALLIASPTRGLSGPLNDVETISSILTKQNFGVTRCCGDNATRDGILTVWRRLITETVPGDAVVIYYSGHGGLVETPRDEMSSTGLGENWRMQFILPVDYDESTDDDFRGILDVELSYLLRDTTLKTDNVTVILDCCHAGRMARYPGHGGRAFPKRISGVQHYDLRRHVERLRRSGQLRGETNPLGNQNAVRIMATAATETAWEYENAHGEWTGALTDALARALEEAQNTPSGYGVSWRTTLLRVCELVNHNFPQQHPVAEGPDVRLLFSTAERTPGWLQLRIEQGEGVLQGGRVAGVCEGNVYCIMPSGHESLDYRLALGTATVTNITGFYARVELQPVSLSNLPDQSALAFIQKEALPRWPVVVPSSLDILREKIAESKFLRPCNPGEANEALAEVRHDGDQVVLCTKYGVEIASQSIPGEISSADAYSAIATAATQLARAQHLLTLQYLSDETRLGHSVDITIGLVDKGKPGERFQQDGNDTVVENDRLYISLDNNGADTVYLSVFDINVAGMVTLISENSSSGIELKPGRSSILGKGEFRLEGLKLSWPKGVAKSQEVHEQLVLILTNRAVDLRQLKDPESDRNAASILYDVVHVPFSLTPQDPVPIAQEQPGFALGDCPWPSEREIPIPAAELPSPDAVSNYQDIPPFSPAMGAIGAVYRATKGIPPCIWVINQHSEEITVVVSKYRPNRQLSGAGLAVSGAGGGFDFQTTTFVSPATQKTLAPQQRDPERSTAAFPLWTRKEGFAVLSIFTSPDRRLYIENDRIPIGATAYFTNQPDLRIVEYDRTTTEKAKPAVGLWVVYGWLLHRGWLWNEY